MTTRASLPLVALLACALAATAVPTPAVAGDAMANAAQAAGARNRRKLRNVLRRKGLAKLPSVAGALAGHGRKTHRGMAAAVVGTPPTLVSIGGASVEDVFWRPGVLDAIVGGSASPEQCGEFWVGQADGQSGGLGACHMAENVGYSLGDILSGDTSLCYMKQFPTRANVNAGAVTLLAGEFPDGDPSHLFSVPAGAASRVVEVEVSGEEKGPQNVFLRVHSEDENQAAGDLYAVDLWFCRGGAQARGFDHIRITNAGEFTSEEQQADEGGSYVSLVTGFVNFTNGEVVYDTARGRQALVTSTRSDGGAFKAAHEIRSDNTIASRSYDIFGDGSRYSYVVASFAGAGLDSLRFLAGAFKERQLQTGGGPPRPDVIGSTEYRSTFYAASPGSALESQLGAVDFDTDAFYAAPPSVTVDASAFACDATPDVALALDFANPAGVAVRARCEARPYDDMHFCHEDPVVSAAEQGFGAACFGPH